MCAIFPESWQRAAPHAADPALSFEVSGFLRQGKLFNRMNCWLLDFCRASLRSGMLKNQPNYQAFAFSRASGRAWGLKKEITPTVPHREMS